MPDHYVAVAIELAERYGSVAAALTICRDHACIEGVQARHWYEVISVLEDLRQAGEQ